MRQVYRWRSEHPWGPGDRYAADPNAKGELRPLIFDRHAVTERSFHREEAGMNDTWNALAREAGFAAEHIAFGTSTLDKANYAHHGYYGQAFFALSIGFERAAKVALVVDHALENDGMFPTSRTLRTYGHDLNTLLKATDDIAHRRGFADEENRLPRSDIHEGIIQVLSDFATNITRYYNLDLVTGDARAANRTDPVSAWFSRVTLPVVKSHLSTRQRVKHELNATVIEALLGGNTKVIHTSEQGKPLNTPYDASMQSAATEFAKPYTRMYVLQIARFMGRVLSELGYASQRASLDTIPHLSEFFAIFNNSDRYFKDRKTWSIYHP